jgi:hypothetical protein
MTGALFGFVELQAAKDAERWVIFFVHWWHGLSLNAPRKIKKMPKDQQNQTSDRLQINESYLGPILKWLKIGYFSMRPKELRPRILVATAIYGRSDQAGTNRLSPSQSH